MTHTNYHTELKELLHNAYPTSSHWHDDHSLLTGTALRGFSLLLLSDSCCFSEYQSLCLFHMPTNLPTSSLYIEWAWPLL